MDNPAFLSFNLVFHPFNCSFHRFIEFPLVSRLFLSFRRNFEQSRAYSPPLFFHSLFFSFQKLIEWFFNVHEKIYIYIYKTKRFRIEGFGHCGIDSKWIDLKCSAISTRLNKIISFPFSIFHATHHFIAISLFYQNRTLYYIFGSVFDPPPFPLPPYEYNIDHYDIYLYITILFD